MIEKDSFHHFNYIKKEDMTGSMNGMRYMLRKEASLEGDNEEEKGKEVLGVTIWPGPYGYAKTAPELKQRKEFEFSPEGVEQAGEWLNEQYVTQLALWKTVKLV